MKVSVNCPDDTAIPKSLEIGIFIHLDCLDRNLHVPVRGNLLVPARLVAVWTYPALLRSPARTSLVIYFEGSTRTHMLSIHTMLLFYLLVFVPVSLSAEGVDSQCHESLGMESGRISDAQLSASSSYEINSVGPLQARLNNNKGGGAWCPKSFISETSLEFLEIDLGEEYSLHGVVTQGRFANGLGQEFAEYYRIQYWRKGMLDFEDYRDSKGVDLFKGNRDTYTEVETELEPSFQASRVRVIPFSYHPRTICMRVELKGCKAAEGSGT